MAVRHLIIRGSVQGVGYRYSLALEAERLGIAGWVRNRRDGSVEAMISGGDEAVALLIHWAREGPPAANVTRVEVAEGSGEYHGFEQRPSA